MCDVIVDITSMMMDGQWAVWVVGCVGGGLCGRWAVWVVGVLVCWRQAGN